MPKVLASPGASSMPRTAAAKVTPWHPFWAAEGRFGPIAAFSDLRRAVMTGVSVQAPRGDHNTPFGRLLGAERSQGSQQGLPKRAP